MASRCRIRPARNVTHKRRRTGVRDRVPTGLYALRPLAVGLRSADANDDVGASVAIAPGDGGAGTVGDLRSRSRTVANVTRSTVQPVIGAPPSLLSPMRRGTAMVWKPGRAPRRTERMTARATHPGGTPGILRSARASVGWLPARADSPKRVRTGPGLTVVAAIPRPLSSRLSPSLKPWSAHLVEPYTLRGG